MKKIKINETLLSAIVATLILGALFIFLSDNNTLIKEADGLMEELNSAEDKHQSAIKAQNKKMYEDYCQALLDVVSNGNKIIEKYHATPNYKPELIGQWKYLAKTIYSERCDEIIIYGLFNDGLDWRNWE